MPKSCTETETTEDSVGVSFSWAHHLRSRSEDEIQPVPEIAKFDSLAGEVAMPFPLEKALLEN